MRSNDYGQGSLKCMVQSDLSVKESSMLSHLLPGEAMGP